MARYKPRVFTEMLSNCEQRGDCLRWKGEFDEFGNPVMKVKRHKEGYVRQDVILYEEAYPEAAPIDEEYLVHECGERGCLSLAHLRYLTEPEERAEHDRSVRAWAKRLIREGKDLDEVMRTTGLSVVRLMAIEIEIQKEMKSVRVVS